MAWGTDGGNLGGAATANEGETGFDGGLGYGGTETFADPNFSFDTVSITGQSPGLGDSFGGESFGGADPGGDGGYGGFYGDTSNQNTPDPFGKFTKGIPGFLANQALGKLVSTVFGQAAPIASGVLGMGKSAATGNPAHAAHGFMSAIGNMATSGGLGLANGISSALGFGPISGTPNNASSPATASGGGGSMDLGSLAGLLSSMYQGNQQSKAAGGAMGQLNDLFSPNSPYAQHMRQMMERKDAAGGRRSQYGPRETQLAALLADRQAQVLSGPGYGNLMQRQQQGRSMGLNNLIALMGKGGPLNGMVNQAGRGLSDMFNGYSDQWAMGANAGPQMPSFGGADPGGSSGYEDFWG